MVQILGIGSFEDLDDSIVDLVEDTCCEYLQLTSMSMLQIQSEEWYFGILMQYLGLLLGVSHVLEGTATLPKAMAPSLWSALKVE